MGYSKDDREYDQMHEGFHITKLEKEIKNLRSVLRIIAEDGECLVGKLKDSMTCACCIARDALEWKE